MHAARLTEYSGLLHSIFLSQARFRTWTRSRLTLPINRTQPDRTSKSSTEQFLFFHLNHGGSCVGSRELASNGGIPSPSGFSYRLSNSLAIDPRTMRTSSDVPRLSLRLRCRSDLDGDLQAPITKESGSGFRRAKVTHR